MSGGFCSLVLRSGGLRQEQVRECPLSLAGIRGVEDRSGEGVPFVEIACRDLYLGAGEVNQRAIRAFKARG